LKTAEAFLKTQLQALLKTSKDKTQVLEVRLESVIVDIDVIEVERNELVKN
jgi:hypothetical protein